MTVRFLRDLPSSSAKGEWFNLLWFSPFSKTNWQLCYFNWSKFIYHFFFLTKGQTDCYKEGYKACLQRISAMLPQSNLETETRQRVNEFIQHSMVSASSCQNCCTQNSKMISQMHHRLVSLRNSSSATEKHSISSASAPSQPQPVDMWRPWWPDTQQKSSGKLFIINFAY